MYVLLTRKDCPFCEKAKELLTSREEKFSEFDVYEYPVLRMFLKHNDIHTVPQIFWKGDLIGGFTDLEDYIKWNESFIQSELDD